MSIVKNGNTLAGIYGGIMTRDLTQAQYDALPDSKYTDGIYYNITDSDKVYDAVAPKESLYGQVFDDFNDCIRNGIYSIEGSGHSPTGEIVKGTCTTLVGKYKNYKVQTFVSIENKIWIRQYNGDKNGWGIWIEVAKTQGLDEDSFFKKEIKDIHSDTPQRMYTDVKNLTESIQEISMGPRLFDGDKSKTAIEIEASMRDSRGGRISAFKRVNDEETGEEKIIRYEVNQTSQNGSSGGLEILLNSKTKYLLPETESAKTETIATREYTDSHILNDVWKSSGARWDPNANVTMSASKDNDEWSFNMTRNGHTGTMFHVWDSDKNSMLQVTPDDGKVKAPYGFVGGLDANNKNITNLPLGGGIFWNPYAESATDGTDAASITVSTSGGATQMTIRQDNDTNDTINLVAGEVYKNGSPIVTHGFLDRLTLSNGYNAGYTGDLNDITWNSLYNVACDSVSNSPFNSWGFVATMIHSFGSHWATQVAYSMNSSNHMWIRYKYDGSWTGWTRFVTESEIWSQTKFPNYGNRAVLTTDTANGVAVSMPWDGWLHIYYACEDEQKSVVIDGAEFILSVNDRDWNGHSVMFPVKGGASIVFKGPVRTRIVSAIPMY